MAGFELAISLIALFGGMVLTFVGVGGWLKHQPFGEAFVPGFAFVAVGTSTIPAALGYSLVARWLPALMLLHLPLLVLPPLVLAPKAKLPGRDALRTGSRNEEAHHFSRSGKIAAWLFTIAASASLVTSLFLVPIPLEKLLMTPAHLGLPGRVLGFGLGSLLGLGGVFGFVIVAVLICDGRMLRAVTGEAALRYRRKRVLSAWIVGVCGGSSVAIAHILLPPVVPKLLLNVVTAIAVWLYVLQSLDPDSLICIVRAFHGRPDPEASRLSGLDTDAVAARLESLLSEEQLFIRHEIDAETTAAKLGITRHQLSSLVKRRYGMTLDRLINRYRIDKVQKLIREYPNRTLLEIAVHAGFSSKATFNRVFKRETGVTPRQFKNNHDHWAQ